MIEYTRLDVREGFDMDIPIWLMAPVNNKLDIQIWWIYRVVYII